MDRRQDDEHKTLAMKTDDNPRFHLALTVTYVTV